MPIDDDTPIRGRDLRETTWFWIDKSFVEVFMPHMDAYAFAVYGILCYHVNLRTGVAFPSVATIAREINAAPNTVRKALNLLSELGLIRIEQRTKDNEFGEPIYSSNEYELVDVNELAKKISRGTAPHAQPSASDEVGTAPHAVGVLHHMHTNKKNNNKKNLTSIDSFPEPADAVQSDDPFSELDDPIQDDQIVNHKYAQASARLTTPSAFNTPHLQSSAKVSSPKADKPAKAPKEDLSSYDLRVAANKPRLTDCILRALAMALFDCTDDPVSIASYEGRLKWIMYGKKEPDFTLGLIKFEQRRNNGVCDYQGIADALEGFRAFVGSRKLLWGMVQSPKNFIGYWQEYRNEERKQNERVWD